MSKLKIRYRNGYRQFYDRNEGRWEYTHRRAAEKKYGEDAIRGKHVHHIDHDKTNNHPRNLAYVQPHIHRHIHNGHDDACFRCGLSGHRASDCTARRDFRGDRIRG